MRPRSPLVTEVKAKLLTRLQNGFGRPGTRFFSNREIAARFGVSYQTAHRLVGELVAEGWLERRPASGTYLAGAAAPLARAELLFDARARRPGSFGARLHQELTAALAAASLAHRTRWIPSAPPPHPAARSPQPASSPFSSFILHPSSFPIRWETPAASMAPYSLLLNDHPPAGLAASFVDSVAVDDFSGGVCAAELLVQWAGPRARFAVLAGPVADPRAGARTAGFLQRLPRAAVHHAASWFYEGGRCAAAAVMAARPAAVFCGNDRLAEGLLDHCREAGGRGPFLVGFDDAPVAERLNFSTVAIPWAELARAAVGIVKKRLGGDTGTAARQVFAPRPVIRLLRA